MKFFIGRLYIVVNVFLELFTTNKLAVAQSIQTDGTTPTQPESCSGNCIIEGGLQQGNNLFHSFERFNVDSGAKVLFQNSEVANIFTRVTGNELSKILGTLSVQDGNANLFLINPNGIIFGQNSSLDLNGSFIATTANAIRFGEQGFLNTTPDDIPLLTINPSALFFAKGDSGVITSQSVESTENISDQESFNLQVPDGKSLLLVGGDITLNGGQVNAFGGRVELGGLAEAGEVQLNYSNTEEQNISLSFPNQLQKADVRLTNGVLIDVLSVNGGDIAINAKNITISNSTLKAGIREKLGTPDSQAGNIILNATKQLKIINHSLVTNQVSPNASGSGGNININSGSLFISDESYLQAPTAGIGDAGDINIIVPDGTIKISNGSLISTAVALLNKDVIGIGEGGNIKITAKEIVLEVNSEINAVTFGQGDAGDIEISLKERLIISFDSTIQSSVGETIEEETKEILPAIGNGGKISIQANTIFLDSGGQLSANVVGVGKGGNISLNVFDSVNIIGSGIEGYSSGIVTATEQGGEGQAGNITVKTNSFRIADGAIVSSQTINESDGGDIVINANTFEAVNGGQIVTSSGKVNPSVSSTDDFGDAGNIFIKSDNILLSGSDPNFTNRIDKFPDNVGNEAPGNSGFFASSRQDSSGLAGDIKVETVELTIQEGAEIKVSAEGTGEAGSLNIDAGEITLDDGSLTAETRRGSDGNITITDADTLLLLNNSQITTDASQTATGGNITINSDVITLLDDSDITANAVEGQGGNVQITTESVFQDFDSEISASSEFGIDGEININSPEVDPSSGLVVLPATLVDPTQLIAQTCPSNGEGENEFIVTGRGGLPPDPSEIIRSDTDALVDFGEPIAPQPNTNNETTEPQSIQYPSPGPNQIVEATNMIVTPEGKVFLTADAPNLEKFNLLPQTKPCSK